MELVNCPILECRRHCAGDFEEGMDANPTDVRSFMIHLFDVLKAAFGSTSDEMATMKKYLHQLYMFAVFDGKNFRDSIPNGESFNDEEGDVGVTVIEGIDNAFEFQLPKEYVLGLVVRGNDEKSVRSEIHTVEDSKGIQKQLAVMTYKLFQACISLFVAFFGGFHSLPSAPLGANVVRSCRLAEAAPEKNHWGLHAHAGLKFVAQYVYQCSKIDKPDELKRKNLPSFASCVFMAYRMDQQRIANAKEKTKEDYSTVRAIFQATQPTDSEQKSLTESLKKDVKNWGPGITAAQAAASLFANELIKMEKGSSNTSKASEAAKSNTMQIVNAKEKSKEDYSTVRAIFQATQLTDSEQKSLKKDVKNWGSGFTGAAQAAASLLVNELKKVEKGSSNPFKGF